MSSWDAHRAPHFGVKSLSSFQKQADLGLERCLPNLNTSLLHQCPSNPTVHQSYPEGMGVGGTYSSADCQAPDPAENWIQPVWNVAMLTR